MTIAFFDAACQLLEAADRVQDALMPYSLELVVQGSRTTPAGRELRDRLSEMSTAANGLRDQLTPELNRDAPHGAEAFIP